MLKLLQDELAKLWTDELYSEQFKNSPSKYKDFDHALKHVRKAAQALENMTEEADHAGAALVFEQTAIAKYIADIVISAIRLANVAPTGVLNVEKAVLDRIERKMGVKLGECLACPACGAAVSCSHHDSLGRCHCSGELGPCCKCS
jgi:predicted nucleotide-binding protein